MIRKVVVFVVAISATLLLASCAGLPGRSQVQVQPMTIASEAFQAEIRALPKKPAEPRESFAARKEKFDRAQQKRIDEHNLQVRQRYAAILGAGGWQKALPREIERALVPTPLTSGNSPGAKAAMNSQADRLRNMASSFQCGGGRPSIADELSHFDLPQLFWQTAPDSVEKDLVIEPLADVMIFGCGFGAQPGEVRMIVNPATGGHLTLNPVSWSDSMIVANLGPNPGYLDQAAQLVVIKKGGSSADPSTMSPPVDVQFVQRRVVAKFDIIGHLNDAVADSCATTTSTDNCFVVGTATLGRLPTVRNNVIIASHYTFCCSAVDGVDGYAFKLKNGWQIPLQSVMVTPRFNYTDSIEPWSFVDLFYYEDFQRCGSFSSGTGTVKSATAVAPTQPDYQAQIDVAWHVGSNCSGVIYGLEVFIYGPEGVPYD